MSLKITNILFNGQSGMRSSKYQRVTQSLNWRQKYMKCEYYELEVNRKLGVDNEDVNGTYRIHLKQIENGEMKGLGTGTFVWPAAHVISKYLEKKYKTMDNLNVCDLGSGTGCAGLAAAVLGAKVTLTDQKQLLFLLEENKRSLCDKYSKYIDPNNIRICEYNWEEKPCDEMNMPFDLVLVSDCVLPKLYPIDILIEGLVKVMSSSTIAIFSYEHRLYSDFDPRLEFRRLAALKGLSVSQIPISEHDTIYSCDDIELWQVTWNDNMFPQSLEFSQLVEPMEWGDVDNVSVIIRILDQNNQKLWTTIQLIINQRVKKEIDHSDQGSRESIDVIGSYLWLSSVIASRIFLSYSYQNLRELVDLNNSLTDDSQFHCRPRVLELGAGCGLTSLVLWLKGYDVVSTDTKQVIDLLHHNIRTGKQTILQSQNRNVELETSLGSFNVYEINWFDGYSLFSSSSSNHMFDDKYDLIVCADCCYSSVAIIPLFDLLSQACSPSTIILMVNELRSSWDEFLCYARRQERSIRFQDIMLTDRDCQLCHENRLLTPYRPVHATVGRFV